MINKIFPYKIHLHMLQLEEYQALRFLRWISSNFFVREYEEKKPLVWTFKARFISIAALIHWFLLTSLLYLILGPLGVVLGVVLGTQSYIFILLGLVSIKPYEIVNRLRVKYITRKKILSLKEKGLKVIGITGSYGKTSVKDFLYQILRKNYSVLKTPESYNTLFGIVKVVDLELDDSYDFFICEMGAYKIGEIKELCETVEPDHAILTGINEQHLERFGSIENTIQAKFELVECTDPKGHVVVNGNSPNVLENYEKYKKDSYVYGKEDEGFYLKNIETGADGSTFDIYLDGKSYSAKTNLIGESNLENILAASTMSYLLGMEPEKIVEAIKDIKPVPHRLELKEWDNGLLVIDNAYSSNVTGFKAALNLLNKFENKIKILATPGIVELGDKTESVHEELGKLAESICDKIILVGESNRTKALEYGINNPKKATFIKSIKDLHKNIKSPKDSVVLIENDLPENY